MHFQLRTPVSNPCNALLVAAAVLVFFCGVSVCQASADQRKPNLVIILADDLGYSDIGVHGCTDIPTPNIDALARSGVRCTQGYSSHSYCSPMRAGLMACRYQHRFGYENNMPYDAHNRYMGIPGNVKTIASRLRDSGYVTGMVGKWHLGAAHPFHPNKRGFDFFYGFLGGGHDYFTVDLHRALGEGYFDALQRNGQPEGLDGYLTTVLASEATEFIEGNHDQPFFLYVAFNAPHTPMQAPEEYLGRFSSISDKRRRTYAAMVNAMDDGIGVLLASLERLQLREKTLIFFLSDNGGPENANGSNNDPLRGQKGQVYEGGIRVPFMASWPSVLPDGVTYDEPVISIDISRTMLAVGGADTHSASALDGVNLIPYFQGERKQSPHEALFWRQSDGRVWAVRAGDDKLLCDERATGEPELYRLNRDISETENHAISRIDRVRALQALFDRWDKSNRSAFFPSYRDYWKNMDKVFGATGPQKKRP